MDRAIVIRAYDRNTGREINRFGAATPIRSVAIVDEIDAESTGTITSTCFNDALKAGINERDIELRMVVVQI